MVQDASDIIIRLTEKNDHSKIQKLIDSKAIQTFGKINLIDLLERGVFSLTLIKENDVIGFLCFSDEPHQIKRITNHDGVEFNISSHYPMFDQTTSLFLDLIIVDDDIETNVLRSVFRTAFKISVETNQIFLLSYSTSDQKVLSKDPFKKINIRENDAIHLHIIERHKIFPALYCRIAKIEDNDDLVPLFDAHTSILRENYGEYYIAELVEAQNDELKCIVAECKQKAVGFISATKRVNLDYLNKTYDLKQYNGLMKTEFNNLMNNNESIPMDLDAHKLTVDDHRQRQSYEVQAEELDISEQNTAINTNLSEEIMTKQYTWIQRPIVNKLRQQEKPETFIIGECDAFAIQLYAFYPEYASRSVDVLPILFDQFPGINHAIISVPRLSPYLPILPYFRRCRIKAGQDPEDELFVLHRSGLLRDFKVRRTKHEDRKQIEMLISHMHETDQRLILDDLESYIAQGRDTDGGVINSFVAVSLNRIVGIVIFRDEKDVEWLRANYAVDDFISFGHHAKHEHASLFHFLLSVNYHCKRARFLREVLRQTGRTCLYYRIQPAYAPNNVYSKSTLINCLSNLQSVKPRRQIIYPNSELMYEKLPEERVLKKFKAPPGLFMATAKLLACPRIYNFARIVVVGASTTGLAFLTTLTTCPTIHFANITLITPHGFPCDRMDMPEDLAVNFLSTDHCFPLEELGKYALRYEVNVVEAKMTGIDRNFKKVFLDNGGTCQYDFLILTPGLQYHTCCPIEEEKPEDHLTYEIPYKPVRRFTKEYPDRIVPINLFTINDVTEAESALRWLREEYLPSLSTEKLNVPEWKKINRPKPVRLFQEANMPENFKPEDIEHENESLIVYGNTLDAYTCIAVLRGVGIPGDHITLVLPPLDERDKPPFEDELVASTMRKTLLEEEVRVFDGFSMHYWNSRETANGNNEVDQVVLCSANHTIPLTCKGLFCFHDKTVDFNFFNAVNNACLVFDARLVIDINFHTNDPAIRAAGPATKLKRIYYNDRWGHYLASSYEIGCKLGKELLKRFDVDGGAPLEPVEDEVHLLPEFEEPKVVGACLPGGYNYLYVSKPALKDLTEERIANRGNGRILTTGEPGKGNGYFAIHVNMYHEVQSIVCLSKTKFHGSNYIRLYRMHEKLLNKLISRFDEGLIQDFYEFLNDVWPLAIYHDRFADFHAEIKELLRSDNAVNEKPTLVDLVRDLIKNGELVDHECINKLKSVYAKQGYKKQVEQRLIHFISRNYNLLPMYAKPDMV